MWNPVRQALRTPLPIGALYLALIPMYASIYSTLPTGSFFDSNLAREPAHLHDETHLLTALGSVIRRRISPRPWRESIGDAPDAAVHIDRSTVRVPQLRLVGHNEILAEVTGEVTQLLSNPAPKSGTIGAEVTWPFGQWVLATEPYSSPGAQDDPDVPREAVVASDATGATRGLRAFPPLAVLMPSSPSAQCPGPRQICPALPLEPSLLARLALFGRASEGDPSAASQIWLRLAYFSATVVTTLGFGDIAPVTSAARVWVTSETVLGVVLIGLFLSAVAQTLLPYSARLAAQGEPNVSQPEDL